MKIEVIQKGKITTRQNRSHHGTKISEFVAVDGEGETINGRHEYVLIGIGNEQLANPKGLKWWQIFEFLYSHYNPGVSYVGFFLGYDFTQWLKTLPESRAAILLAREGMALRRRNASGGCTLPFSLFCDELCRVDVRYKKDESRPRAYTLCAVDM